LVHFFKQWNSSTYPNPRTNATLCNTWSNSTLCDPDHILTDQWRLNIHENLQKQMQKLRDADILYNENAPEECHQNSTDGIKIYVILAKRIQTASNQSITDTDLTDFGNELAERYGLNDQICKNFLMILGVEAAKLAYVRVCVSLHPETLFNQHTGFFNAKNYMEGLNNIINEIGEQMIDPFKCLHPLLAQLTLSILSQRWMVEKVPFLDCSWMALSIFFALIALGLLLLTRYQMKKHNQVQMQIVVPEPNNIDHVLKHSKNDSSDGDHLCSKQFKQGL
uniref:PBPe domain-containing protein n=1 Tax=Syphacia muris TaxID=451379 RepID=A0A0N5AQ75_9BILA